ncbi:troponin C, isoallergen Bla g 6.0201-like isoform X2 [Diachasmimorpha longicaudata]
MAFDTFDKEKKGVIKTSEVQTILDMLGVEADAMAELDDAINEVDTFGSGELKYEDFCTVAAKFMEEDVDVEALKSELKEAFRLYDREGNGYITTDTFREILCEIDENLTDEQLDMIIEEIDADGSGTLDFEEFVEAMTH